MLDIAQSPVEKPSVRAPLLWILVPQILGYAAALNWELSPVMCLLSGAALSLKALWICRNSSYNQFYWSLCLSGSVILLSWAWYQECDPLIRDRELLKLPPRAVEIDLEVERIFLQKDEYDRISGVGKALDVPSTIEHILGTKVYFKAYRQNVSEPLIRGDQIRIKGILQPIGWNKERKKDFEDYLLRSHIYTECSRGILDGKLSSPDKFLHFCHRANELFQRILKNGESNGTDSEADVLVAMMLGEKNALSTEQKQDFRYSGTMHLFAISGLHVGVVALVVGGLFGILPLPRKLKIIAGLGSVFLYVQITGGQPSAMRAFIMVTCLWGAYFAKRQSNPFPALVTSAVIILTIDPSQIRNLGFQFSYAVVSVILLYGLPLAEGLKTYFEKDLELIPEQSISRCKQTILVLRRWFLVVFSVSFSATLASTPLTMSNFGLATPGTIFLNVLLVTMAALAIKLGAISLVSGVIGLGFLSSMFISIAKFLIWLMLLLVDIALEIPGFYQEIQMRNPVLGSLGISVLIGSLLACHQWRKQIRWHFFWIPPAVFAIYLTLTMTR